MRFLPFLHDAQSRDKVLHIQVLLWAIALYAAFQPGLMSPDSIDQYTQGLTGSYNDIHPPLGSWLLGLSGKLTGSPWLAFVGQLIGLGIAMSYLARSSDPARGKWGLIIMGAFLLTPTVWALAVVLWKDVMMAAALLGAVAALKVHRPVLALLLLLAGVAFRHNAIVAAIPLAIPTMAQLAPHGWRWPLKIPALVVMIGGLALVPALPNHLLNANRGWAAGQLFLFDLAGIYTVHPELLPSSLLAEKTSAKELAISYTPTHVWPLFGGAEGARPIPFDPLVFRRQEFVDEWFRVLRAHPTTWMKHRIASFRHLTGAFAGPMPFPILQDIDANPFHLRSPREGLVNQWARTIENWAGKSIFFRGWAWLLVLGALTVVALRRVRRTPIACCTALSGLGYALSYLVIGIGNDFRFIYWSVIATFATLALLTTEEAPPGTEAQPRPG
ncbi:hypothetical protein [Myxococcus sp. AB036A]|uniref:hypothetical protein n=1 Tax=Myxococcus sp. AB036A TaxID=2562793 RepID=UPI00114773D0|nr:hypothetical protein [Myxococcus sp. AB036A]